jgi:GntR family transcriptional regulator, phosphonate transport system regulatory protein
MRDCGKGSTGGRLMTAEFERGGGVALWRQIAERLRAEIVAGVHAPGARLPAETELAARFAVNRHTVRRAMATLASEGMVRIGQGSGTFVEHRRLPYPISRRTRFSEIVSATARSPAGALVAHAIEHADARLSTRLGVPVGTRLQRLDTISAADGVPVSMATHWVPAARFPRIIEIFAATGSFTRAMEAHGIIDYSRRSTRVTARPAEPGEADALALTPGSTVLVTDNVDVDADAVPVQTSQSHFAANRVEFVIEFG